MHIRIDHAQPDDAPIIAQMAGSKAFGFHQEETEARAQSWLRDGKYFVLLARDGVQPEPLGFLALYESYAFYTEGAYGAIPEFYVRPAHRSNGVEAILLEQVRRLGQSRGCVGSK